MADYVLFDQMQWEIGAEYEVIHVLTDGALNRHGCFSKTFKYLEPELPKFYHNSNLVLVPTLHVHYNQMPDSIMSEIKAQISSADAVFFESVGASDGTREPTLQLRERQSMIETYSQSELSVLRDLLESRTGIRVSLETFQKMSTMVLIFPHQALRDPSQKIDGYLELYAKSCGKPVFSLDTQDMQTDWSGMKQYLEAQAEYSFQEALQRLYQQSRMRENYLEIFVTEPQPEALSSDLPDLLYARNLAWRQALLQYMSAHPTHRVIVCVGAAHLRVPSAYQLSDNLVYGSCQD